ncbi:thioredoxin-related transmembrane protein 4 isoform X3 [Rhinolophus ferrumequinum]|uniref:thioredoxin-related transmembrane protein 4 isoform X3 n=1 Tax=Rhinolophus ferrumequinum TaxID=59479 RepID=UPI00140F9D2D|nr:thioredoxin-related transmembrane protein 4 isoform X3 [Rhinolophus ferrumequinum]
MAGGLCGPLLTALLAACVTAAASEAGPKQAVMPEEQSLVLPMTASNWTLVMEGEWMLKFYAPWCPSCQQTDSEWETFAKNGEILHISVGKVDVIQEPGLSGRFFVTTLPAFFHAKDGIFRRYRGPGIYEDLQNYILEKKWQSVEPLTGWKSPASLTMSGMAGLFSISGKIWHLHNYFTVTLGIPAWCSYVFFVIATLIFGLLMGLILVVISECFYVPLPRHLSERSAGSTEGFLHHHHKHVSSTLHCYIMTAIIGIFHLHYNLMGPLWYMQYAVYQNVVMWHMSVIRILKSDRNPI